MYQGADSCYALNEQLYVHRIRHRGIGTLREAAGIRYLIVRDCRRGWSYDHRCRRIRLTRSLFERRALFLTLLAERHGAPG